MTVLAVIATFAAGVLTAVIFIANGSKTSGEFILRDFVVLMWMIVVALWLIASWPAKAHDHNRPGLDSWYSSLKSGKGPCCGGPSVDATTLDGSQWKTEDGGYRVFIEGEWHDVPPEAVLDVPNLDGRALVWPIKGYGGLTIRCFMPGALT